MDREACGKENVPLLRNDQRGQIYLEGTDDGKPTHRESVDDASGTHTTDQKTSKSIYVESNPRTSSDTPAEGIFSWNRLPRELQIKILQYLPRHDLEKCRLLNREMFEIVQHNERLMKRRVIDNLVIRESLSNDYKLEVRVRCDEEEVDIDDLVKDRGRFKRLPRRPAVKPHYPENRIDSTFSLISRCLSKLLKDAVVKFLWIKVGRFTDHFLSLLASCLLDANCRVEFLTVNVVSLDTVNSAVLLRFLRAAEPTSISIFITISDYLTQHSLSPEVLQFIVTRQAFFLISVNRDGLPVPIDDTILAQITATYFEILIPNMVTVDGLKSFLERVGSGKQKVFSGVIYTDLFSSGNTLPVVPNVDLYMGEEGMVFMNDEP